MNLSEYLQHYGLPWESVVDGARRAVALQSSDILFVAGSLTEDLGNEASDLDLFLITSRDDIAFTSLHDVAFSVGGSLVDIRVLQLHDVDMLLNRFTFWAEHNELPRSAFAFTEDERKFLHRLQSGHAIDGESRFGAIREQASAHRLARHKLDWARHLAGTIRVDLVGLRGEREFLSMLLAGQELLWQSADALLAAHGHTNPNPKWRIKLLGRLPDNWEATLPGRRAGVPALQRYLSLHRGPASLDSTSILNHVFDIATFTRNVIVGAEKALLDPVQAHRLTCTPPTNVGERCTPLLDIDFSLRCDRDGEVLGYRAGGEEEFCRISTDALQIIALFDGHTTLESVSRFGDALTGGHGESLLQHLLEIVRQRGYSAPEAIDEDRLSELLRRKIS